MRDSVTQPDQCFTGEAYEYLLETDQIPSLEEIAENDDPTVKVRLFLPGSRFEYYIAAVTDYSGELVLTGYCVSPLGPDCDEFGDIAADEVLNLRGPQGMPVERDCYWTPRKLSEIKETINNG